MKKFNKNDCKYSSCSEASLWKGCFSIFSLAKKDVFMSTGLYSGFYDDGDIKTSIKKTIHTGVKLRIVIDKDGGKPVDWMKDEIKNGKIEIKRSTEKIRHIMIIDDKHIRIEDSYLYDMNETTSENIKNRICFNTPHLAEILKEDMEEIWKKYCVKEEI